MHVHPLSNIIYIYNIYNIILFTSHLYIIGTRIYIIKAIIQITYGFPETGYSENEKDNTRPHIGTARYSSFRVKYVLPL